MPRETLELTHVAGTTQIQAFCRTTSQQLGLELLSVSWSWHYTAPADRDRHHLSVKATRGSHEFGFTCADLEGYPTGQTTEAVNAIIRQALAALLC
jgi:hypothetical protein